MNRKKTFTKDVSITHRRGDGSVDGNEQSPYAGIPELILSTPPLLSRRDLLVSETSEPENHCMSEAIQNIKSSMIADYLRENPLDFVSDSASFGFTIKGSDITGYQTIDVDRT